MFTDQANYDDDDDDGTEADVSDRGDFIDGAHHVQVFLQFIARGQL